MSQRTSFNPQAFFRDKLEYQDTLLKQIDECRESLNLGDALYIKLSIETLLHLITPDLIDEAFKAQLKILDEEFAIDFAIKQIEYKARIKLAMSPDVVPKPSNVPPMATYALQFRACLALLQRKKLLLKPQIRGVAESV